MSVERKEHFMEDMIYLDCLVAFFVNSDGVEL